MEAPDPRTALDRLVEASGESYAALSRMLHRNPAYLQQYVKRGTPRLLAEREGIFCEPASAISLGGALRDIANGKIPEGSLVTCTLTGHGLKDPDTAIRQSAGKVIEIPAESEAVKRAILANL